VASFNRSSSATRVGRRGEGTEQDFLSRRAWVCTSTAFFNFINSFSAAVRCSFTRSISCNVVALDGNCMIFSRTACPTVSPSCNIYCLAYLSSEDTTCHLYEAVKNRNSTNIPTFLDKVCSYDLGNRHKMVLGWYQKDQVKCNMTLFPQAK
jgi:hypothetical protein